MAAGIPSMSQVNYDCLTNTTITSILKYYERRIVAPSLCLLVSSISLHNEGEINHCKGGVCLVMNTQFSVSDIHLSKKAFYCRIVNYRCYKAYGIAGLLF